MANYQDQLLNGMRKEKISCQVYLINGRQLSGTVKAFDNFVIILESAGKQNLIYKHAISTITPMKSIKLQQSE